MGERKVINKYYPPDFDPAKIPKKKRPKNDQVKVRMMLPMSIRCNTCGEYLYKGKKFNSRKETVTGEEYLGIKIFRFYVKCTRCSAELTIKTDPRNSDYVCEFGASRNFEPWRENQKIVEEAKQKREKEELGDAMKALENRTQDSKIEMDILDALDEIRSLNARQSKMDPIEVLLQRQRELEEEQLRLTEEDEMLVQNVFGSGLVKRLEEEEDESENLLSKAQIEKVEDFFHPSKKIKTEPSNNDDIVSSSNGTNKTNNQNNNHTNNNKSNNGSGVKVQVKPKVVVIPIKKEENNHMNNRNGNNSANEKKEDKKEVIDGNALFSLLSYNEASDSDDE
jgi:DNA-directed RNA polymerase subunit RPC12/RpoP